jgi:hypothetical protein
MISHRNVIANIIQYVTHESKPRASRNIRTQVSMGLLPMSHIYALVVVTHGSTYRGDEVIVLPKFDLATFLGAIQRHGIEHMCLVPPVVIALLRSRALARQYDLSSVRFVYTGAAPLGAETVRDLLEAYPRWNVGQGYGMTETATVVCSTSESDICVGTSGSLVPGAKAKIVGFDGKEVTEYETPGELLIQSPSVVLGYLNNERANAETFVWHEDGRWIRTGDEALVRKAPSGHEHLVIVDRIKELIKVKVSCQRLASPRLSKREGKRLTTTWIGPPSRAGRARSPPPRPPSRLRLRRHPNPRRPRRRGAESLRGQDGRHQWQARPRGVEGDCQARGGPQGPLQVAEGRHRIRGGHPQERQREDSEAATAGPGEGGKEGGTDGEVVTNVPSYSGVLPLIASLCPDPDQGSPERKRRKGDAKRMIQLHMKTPMLRRPTYSS